MVCGKRKSTVTLDSVNKKKNQLISQKFFNNEYREIKGINTLSLAQLKSLAKEKEIHCIDDVVARTGTRKEFSVPSFLREVFNKELGDRQRCDHRLVFIAVQAILKHSGFTGFDTVSRTKMDGFYLPSSGYTLSINYTLPEIIQSLGVNVNYVRLKIRCLGEFIKFHGSLSGVKSRINIKVNKKRLVVALKLMWANLDETEIRSNEVVLKFWKTVKDNLALPLLIDLREKANLPPPSCFARLPSDLKLEILELLPAADVAKTACVSQELRFLLSDDELWKKKTLEKFERGYIAAVDENSWKQKFVRAWKLEANKRKTRVYFGKPSLRFLCGKPHLVPTYEMPLIVPSIWHGKKPRMLPF